MIVDLPTDRRALVIYAVGILTVALLIFLRGVDVGINREREQHVAQDQRHLKMDKTRDAANAKIRATLALAAKQAEDSAAQLRHQLELVTPLTIDDSTHVTVHRAPNAGPDVTVSVPPEVIQRLEADARTIGGLNLALTKARAVEGFDSVTVLPDLRATVATSDTLVRDMRTLDRSPSVWSDVVTGFGAGAIAGLVTGGVAGILPGVIAGGLGGAIVHGVLRR